MDDIIDVLNKKNIAMISLTTNQVNELQNQLDVRFPLSYKYFLLSMGKSAGKFMEGTDVFFDKIPLLKDWAEELLIENEMSSLPKNAFVFWMHQGYQVAYFDLYKEENPTVYYFSEGMGLKGFVEKGTLTDFFRDQLIMSDII